MVRSVVFALLVASGSCKAVAQTKVETALGEPTGIEFVETPLDEAIKYLADLHAVRIELDNPAFEKAKRQPELEPVNQFLEGITLRSGLNLVTYQSRCEYRVEADRIVVFPEGTGTPEPKSKKTPASPEPKGNARIRKALSSQAEFDFNEDPLRDVLSFLADVHGIQIVLDWRAIEPAKIERDVPVTAKSRPGKTLNEELDRLLAPHKLEACVENEVLFVTTAKVAATK